MRSFVRHLLAVFVLLPSLLLVACGGGGTLPSSTSASGPAALSSLALTPNTPPTLAPGGTRQFSATGIFSDGSTAAISSGETWVSSNTAVATVSSSGLVTALAAGSATITVTDAGRSANVTVTVAPQPATLSSIALAPTSGPALAVGSTRTLTATGTYSDGGTATLGSGVTWTSSAPAVATISSSGVVTAVAAGSTTITASESGVSSAGLAITVAPVAVTLSSVTVSPATTSALGILSTQQLSATGHYSDNSTAAISTGITWQSDAPAVASVSATGLVTGQTAGTAHITATVGGVVSSPAATVTVVNAAVPAAAAQVFYGGNYAANVSFVAFGGSVNSVSVDSTTPCPGQTYGSLKINFAAAGSYTGGALVDSTGPRNLSAYDALVMWAKAGSALTTDKFGLGNNAATVSGYEAERPAIALTTSWQKVIVPIPDGTRLATPGIAGLFHFADGTNHSGSMWVCDVYYASLGSAALGSPTPTWNNAGVTVANGATYQIAQTDMSVNWAGGASAYTEGVANYGYFSYTPSNSAATSINGSGLITGTNNGSSAVTSNIAAKLGTTASTNTLPVTVNPPVTVPPPSAAPATPATLASAVVAIFDSSNTVTPLAGTTYPNFGGTTETDVTVGGRTLKEYVGLSYSGIQLAARTSIAAATHVHFDVYTTNGKQFGFKIVTFNAAATPAEDGAGQVVITNPASGGLPALVPGQWVSVDIPLSALAGADGFTSLDTSGLFQLLPLGNTPNGALSGSGTFWLDNLYFY